ncbi:MAG: excinuclease ABC subunit C, partial [Cyanobacteria bacterium]|nr:excinuclease ABC subunit C [Cyanobacteriota bacterium]
GSRSYEIPLVQNSTEEEAYSSFIYQFYQDQSLNGLPDEVILQYPVEDEEILEAWLNQQTKKGTVKLIHPKTGVKKDMLAFAIKNAREALEISKRQHQSVSLDPSRMLLELQESLGLPDLPVRMECYDISHVQGSFTVASMVVFIDGNPDKSEYKRFKIQSAEGKPDDFKSMAEVIRRRFSHSGEEGWDDPDLVIIDGGKGQLSSAVEALREQGIEEQPIISLAKKFEEVFLPGEERPILLPRTSPAFFLLQRIRDEAHRFAITYHRTLRGKAATRSILDEVKGLGPKRKQKLLEVFKTVENVLSASSEALEEALKVSPSQGEALHQAIQKAVSGENENI